MKQRRFSLVAVFVLLTTLVLAACGDNTATTAPATTAAVTTTATTASTQTTSTASSTVAATTQAKTATATTTAAATATTVSSGHPGIYREAWFGVDPVTLDPQVFQINGDTTLYMYGNLYIGLTAFDEKLNVVPGLAKEWKISSDSTVWTFTLNDAAKFASGRAVTSADVVYSFERALDPKLKNTQAFGGALGEILGASDKYTGKTPTIAGLKAPDAKTVEITLSRPVAFFDNELASGKAVYIVDKDVVESGAKWWETKSAGAGPFQLAEWKHSESIVLVPNSGWFGPKVKLTRIEYSMVGNQTSSLSLFESGKTDAHWALLTQDIDRFVKDKGEMGKMLHLQPEGLLYTYVLQFNPAGYAPFKDAKVRKAIMMSIDSTEITVNALNDAGYVATGILSNGMPGFKPDQMKFKFDPAAGKKLLAEAGFPDPSKMPELVITQIGSGPDASGPAQSIQNTLKTGLGLPVRIEVVDQQRAISQLREGKVAAWSDMPILTYTDPYAMLSRFSSKSPSNYFGYNNPEIDSLLLKATATQDAKARYAIYQDIEAKLLDDGAIMPIMWAKFYYLQRPWVSGYKTNALGIMPYTEVEVK